MHDKDWEGADEDTTGPPDMSYENGVDGYDVHPTRRSPWRRGHMRENRCVGRPSGVCLQILHTASFTDL